MSELLEGNRGIAYGVVSHRAAARGPWAVDKRAACSAAIEPRPDRELTMRSSFCTLRSVGRCSNDGGSSGVGGVVERGVCTRSLSQPGRGAQSSPV